MRDPINWSFPIAYIWGITVRVHLLFPVVAVGLILQVAYKNSIANAWIDAATITVLTFVAVLLHEFGHCAGARSVEGDAHEILMWPLGGLASVEVPPTPWANFVTTIMGPAVNLALFLIAGGIFFWLTDFNLRPPWNPFEAPIRQHPTGEIVLYNWQGGKELVSSIGIKLLAQVFWINWFLFLLNVLLPAFPLDGGRLLQCALWPRWGYRQAMTVAVTAGFITAIVIGVLSIMIEVVLLLALALFIYMTCRMQMFILESGMDESAMGYDFSQGYTSLERDQPAGPPRRRKPNFIQRWLQRRAARKLIREQEVREQEERRMDELLEKVQQHGLQALSDEEKRFLTRVSARYRNRN